MHLLAVTFDHRTAPIAVRERLYRDRDGSVELLRALVAGSISEAALLCTCNRTDVYVAAEDPTRARAEVLEALAMWAGMEREDLVVHGHVQVGPQACCEHLCRVASGLESLVLGETQVLGQVKEAYLLAAEAGTVGKVLHGLFHQALRCARKVHATTPLGASPVSIGAAAVDLARDDLGDLQGRSALVVGAGETAETVVRRLREAGFGEIFIMNRTPDRAFDLARRYGGVARPIEGLTRLLPSVDVLVISTSAGEPVLALTDIREALASRAKDLVLLDIAVPRNVAPEAASLPGVRLHNIDDLREVADRGRAERRSAAVAAEAVVALSVADFDTWWLTLDLAPTIAALRDHFDDVAGQELARAMRRLGDLDPRQRQIVEQLAHGIVRKLLNEPIVRLKELAGTPYGHEAVRAFALVFALDPVSLSLVADDDAPEASDVREGGHR